MQKNQVRVCADDPSHCDRFLSSCCIHNQTPYAMIKICLKLPLSCFRRLALLQILTVQTESIMATMKNKIPPISPAVTARVFRSSGK